MNICTMMQSELSGVGGFDETQSILNAISVLWPFVMLPLPLQWSFLLARAAHGSMDEQNNRSHSSRALRAYLYSYARGCNTTALQNPTTVLGRDLIGHNRRSLPPIVFCLCQLWWPRPFRGISSHWTVVSLEHRPRNRLVVVMSTVHVGVLEEDVLDLPSGLWWQ